MRPKRMATAVALAMVVALGGATASAATQPVGNPVTHWNTIAVTTLAAFPPAAGGVPPAMQIHMGMTHGAVYDAVNAVTGQHHDPYLLERRFRGASVHAAVATAAYRVLSHIVATVPASVAFPDRAKLASALDTSYAAALAEIPKGSRKEKGIRAGTAAADAMIRARRGDGRYGPSQWTPSSAPGHWQPLLNPQGAPILDPTPWVGLVRPFFLDSPSQLRTVGPLSLTSARYAAEFNEVKDLGSVDSKLRTPEQTHIAQFWQSNVVTMWNAVSRDVVGDETWGIGIEESARLFALQNMAAADAAINCWNDKYHFDFWRPWNAIPRAAEDGNPATEPQAGWVPLITAPYPDHPSGHNCLDAAHLRVLARFIGTSEVRISVTSSVFPGEVRTYDRIADVVAEIIEARIWAGLHFRTADVQAQVLGVTAAEHALDDFMLPVDH